jgi:hypothetical protein
MLITKASDVPCEILYRESSVTTRAAAAGSACTNKILRAAVAAPYRPATTTHARKNTRTS